MSPWLATPEALGLVRIGVHGVFLISVLRASSEELGYLPVTIVVPAGVLALFSWESWEYLLSPAGMLTLKWLLVGSLLMSTLGYCARITLKTSAALVLLHEGILRSFGYFNHDEMAGVICLIILAFTPCTDAFSLDALYDRRPAGPSVTYGYPIFLMQLVVAWVYFTAGINKIRLSGPGYFGADTLIVHSITHSLDNLHDTQYRYAFWLAELRGVATSAMLAGAVVFELAFPLAIFWRRARWWILGVGVVFHIATMLLMNVLFPHLMALYLLFVDWPAVLRRLARSSLARWLRRGDREPVVETFPGTRITTLGGPPLLLWDGECGFCAATIAFLKRMARRPFEAVPYQTVRDRLPPEIVELSRDQMHWVSEDGRVVGGGRALIEVLEAAGHRTLAALLESAPLRPFVSLGYHLVARNRHHLGRLTDARCSLPS